MRSKTRKKSKKWIGLAVALLVVAGGVGTYLLLSDDDEPSDNGTPIAGPSDTAPPEVLYVEGNLLKSIGPSDSDGQQLAEGISAGALPSPDAAAVTWVAFAGPDKPITHLFTLGSDGVETSPGSVPTWKGDGSAFAVLEPVGKTTCSAERCKGPTKVVVVAADSLERTELLAKGRWSLHGWIGDDLVVGDAKSPDQAFLVTGKNASSPLEVPATSINSISPDGAFLTTKAEKSPPEIWSVSGESVEPVGTLGSNDTVLTSVAWSKDSKRVAAVVSELGKPKLAVFAPDDLELVPFTDLEAVGEVFWSPGGGGLVFTAVNRDEGQLEATYCPLDGGDCTIYVTWQTGTSVVGVPQTS